VSRPVEYLDLDDVLSLAERLLGTSLAVRDLGLLGSAVARPQTTVGGADAYPDVWTKAAALLQSIVNNHALVDGNKRLGWLTTAVFLDLNDVRATAASNDDVFELVMEVASIHVELDSLAERLRRMVTETDTG
jgi:death-on-curing protein